MPATLHQTLLSCGVQPSQLVDIQHPSPRALRYVDLTRGGNSWSPPIVVEHQDAARAFVFDGRDFGEAIPEATMNQWCQRVVLRGDPAWTVIMRPGRLEVLSFKSHDKKIIPSIEANLSPDVGVLARFIHDVRSGTATVPHRGWLKDLLANSMQQAVDLGVSPNDAVSLIGWGLFWRFLTDRQVLARKKPTQIAQGATSWTSCLNTKTRALKTLKWLETTFNGSLLPFEVNPERYCAEVFSRVLGNIAVGATAQGQLRLPGAWSELDFSHIPVGLLSEVYEGFAASLDANAAKQKSLHYTPAHLAQFMVSESLRAIEHIDRPRVLDPAVGAGVFLVAVFRALVEREWKRTGRRPARQQIRRILAEQLHAFDLDIRALRLTQLSLYLTALELDPDPTPVEALRFDRLDATLRLRNEPDGSLAAVAREDAGQFDLVIGNPPWTRCTPAAKQRWVNHTRRIALQRLDTDVFDLPDGYPDLAFLWRAGEWATHGGQVTFAMHARWLFGLSEPLFRARHRIFTAFNVTGMINGSALRHAAVWPNVTAPFCMLFARNEPPLKNGALKFFSPYVETTPQTEQAILRSDWASTHTVPHETVKSTPWILKTCFKGDPLANRTLETLLAIGTPLSDYLSDFMPSVRFRNGYQTGSETSRQHSVTHLQGLPDLKGSHSKGLPFLLTPNQLPKFEQDTLSSPRSPDIYRPPLLLIRETVPANPQQPRAFLSQRAIVFNESFHAISFSGVRRGDDHARWLQILLQSQIGTFAALLMDAKFGVERDTIYQESLDHIPVIPLEKFTQAQLTRMHSISTDIEQSYELNAAQFEALNNFVFDMYGLGALERQAIVDTLQTRGPTPASVKRAMTPPTQTERDAFITCLKASVDDVLLASKKHARIDVVQTGSIPWRIISITTDAKPIPPVQMHTFLEQADRSSASLVVYSTRPHHVFVGLPDRYRYWTKTQAVLLAHELLNGTLSHA